MSLVNIPQETPGTLKDKVVVITGAAAGIGAVVVEKLQAVGAKVVYGDVKEPEAPISAPNVTFQKTDVTDYASVLDLFKKAWDLHARVDHAVSNAGLVEIGQLFTDGTDDVAIEEEPTTLVLDVNVKGTVFFTRVGVHFLRKSLVAHHGGGGGGAAPQTDASLLLVSSTTGWGEYPGLFQYSASKHGVLGLFRSTRGFLLPRYGVRINIIYANMTRTQMVTGVIALWEAKGVPINEAADVANTYIYTMTSGRNGEGLYISGGRTYEIEQRLDDLRPEWFGKEVYAELLAGKNASGDGGGWTDRKGGKAENYEGAEVKAG